MVCCTVCVQIMNCDNTLCFLQESVTVFKQWDFMNLLILPLQVSTRDFPKVNEHDKFHIYLAVSHSAPDTLVYDNGCNLHNYCLNREPQFFKCTRFFVDKFHWRNHTGKLWSYHTLLFCKVNDCMK